MKEPQTQSNTPLRAFSVRSLHAAISMHRAHEPNETLARRLEKHVYNYCIERAKQPPLLRDSIPRNWESPMFRSMYKHKVLHVAETLRKFPIVLDNLAAKVWSAKQVPHLRPWVVNPTLWMPIFHQLAKRNYIRRQALYADQDDESPPNGAPCPRCKSRKTDYYQLQTRSADESMTSYFTCMDCDKRWKI
jgi:DNA-directed RNA polymerase subunit M/transcription elongation factor TFIIS